MQTGLRCLLLCIDDKVVRVLRRVLGELEITIEHCMDADTAIQKLTRHRYEAVIVDCTTVDVASRILRGAQASPANKRAITVAILDGETADGQGSLKKAFSMGAHFVLFKPISQEKTKSSLRAVKALMKRERRRHARIPIEIPVEVLTDSGTGSISTFSSDLGENGIAIKTRDFKLPSAFRLRFTLPGTGAPVECRANVAWEGNQVKGLRFHDLAPESHEQLKQWISRQLSGTDADEPPVGCKLTDLSLNACYLQTESPFPVNTTSNLTMKVKNSELRVDGIVRVMHAGTGMGVEFTRNTGNQRAQVEKFIHTLMSTDGAIPEIQVRPDAIESSETGSAALKAAEGQDDPLLTLFYAKADLSTAEFQNELLKQRGAPPEVGV